MRSFLILFLFLFYFFGSCSKSFAQTQDTAKTPINIGDNGDVADSTKENHKLLSALFKLNDYSSKYNLSTFTLTKKEIDYTNYKYAIDFLSYLPTGNQNYFDVIGFPNEAILFNQGNNNFSLVKNNFLMNNLWNGSADLNLIQTESVSEISVVPISRSFLAGPLNSSAQLKIISNDSLSNKPLSRIRYFQSTNDKALIDAWFSAIVHKNLSLELRITNSLYTSDYDNNSSYSVWKAYLKSIYRISDKLHASFSFYHLKSHTDFNGGIIVTSPNTDIYGNLTDVNFSDRNEVTTLYRASGNIYGNIFEGSYTSLKFTYDENFNNFNQNKTIKIVDSTVFSNDNNYKNLNATFLHRQNIGDLFFNIDFSYNSTNYNVDYLKLYSKKNSYYLSSLINYKLLDSSLTPSAYVKFGTYENQKTAGFGFDLIYSFNNNYKLTGGLSYFNKPYIIAEAISLPANFLDRKNNIKNYFAAAEVSFDNFKSSFTYYKIKSDNTPVPIFSDGNLNLNSTKIIFPFTEENESEGLSLIAKIKFWKFETVFNGNYLLSSKNSFTPQNAKYNLMAGLYYRNKLYNDNLDLKTGFSFYYSENLDYRIYDFQMLRSSAYYFSNNSITAFNYYSISNNPYRIDFTLQGRIQDRATFYFAFENILSNKYYYIPYYPMPSGTIRFGISWDLIN